MKEATNRIATDEEKIDFDIIASHRSYLLKIARLELRDEPRSEDCVSDVILQAYERRASFQGRSSLRTWLTTILKHRIIDITRKQWREQPLLQEDESDSNALEFERLFDETGHWIHPPVEAANPERLCQQDIFLLAVQRCVEKLPKRIGQLFVLREVLGCETKELCEYLQITPCNVWVKLFRARMMLKACLERSGFGCELPYKG